MLLAVQNEREWAALCEVVLDDPGLATDERFARNSARVAHRDTLEAVIARRFAELGTGEAVKLLDRAGVANARLNSVSDLLDHPVLTGRDRWRQVGTPGGPVDALLPPASLGGVEPRMDPVPEAGEHTAAILSELGRTEAQIEELRAAGAV